VNGFGDATFVQAAGFLKIVGGDNPLDATWIHPENYAVAERLLAKLGCDPATVAGPENTARIRELIAPLDRQALAAELGIGRLTLDDMIEALCKPGRDPREDLPPPIFRKDVVKFDDLKPGMELRGTVLNVVDFGAFVDVGLSDSGLVHISQLSAGYVRDPHDVIAVGDQVRVWVATVDTERRRVALTMIPPGTERARPAKTRKPRRQPAQAKPMDRSPATESAPAAAVAPRTASPPRRTGKPRRDQRGAPRQPRSGAYEKRAPKVSVPITKAMEEGKEFMRSFGDLLQYHQKKKQSDEDESQPKKHTEPEMPAVEASKGHGRANGADEGQGPKVKASSSSIETVQVPEVAGS
jgi:uncharacterized protein